MKYNNFYFLVFDIETSKEVIYDEKLKKDMPIKTWLSYGVMKLVDIKGNILKTLRFRKWDELKHFISSIHIRFKEKLFCFVHNLSYEFDFLIKNVSPPDKFLCNNSHSVISATLKNINIEFRCTYQLSKVSLSKLGEMYNIPKLDSEYRTIYPNDEITEEEWIYCERDCDIIIPYVIDLLKEYKMLCRLPLTSTGMVRRKLKTLKDLTTNTEWDLMPPEDCYNALVKSFRGATTMSNPRFTNQLLNCRIKSFDEKSKYPGVMLCKKYPYTIERMYKFSKSDILNFKFWIARVKLKDVVAKYDWGVISISTCENVSIGNADIFNGKIINCGSCELYITNVDLDTYNVVYHIGDVEFIEFYPCRKYDYLPEQFTELIKYYAQEKTRIGNELKELSKIYNENDIEYIEKMKEYMDAKAKLNGIYGMMVQKLVQVEYYIDENFIWKEKENKYKYIEGKHLGRNFLYGIFITSYSRYDLTNNIAHNCPYNFVYCDTDSIKFIDIGKEFEDLNDDIPEHLRQYDYLKGFNKFEAEPDYTSFITYGAKKYAYIKKGKFGFTVAGLPKSTKIQDFSEFKLGTVYENCKLAKRYIYHQTVTDVDFETNEVLRQYTQDVINEFDYGGIALFETDYSLNMTESDLIYIRRYKSLWQKRNIQQNILI